MSSIIDAAAQSAALGDKQGLKEILDFLVTEEALGVTFVTEATATTPIPHRDFPAGRSVAEILADPRTLHTADIITRTEYALAGRFATIAAVADLVPEAGPAVVAAAR